MHGTSCRYGESCAASPRHAFACATPAVSAHVLQVLFDRSGMPASWLHTGKEGGVMPRKPPTASAVIETFKRQSLAHANNVNKFCAVVYYKDGSHRTLDVAAFDTFMSNFSSGVKDCLALQVRRAHTTLAQAIVAKCLRSSYRGEKKETLSRQCALLSGMVTPPHRFPHSATSTPEAGTARCIATSLQCETPRTMRGSVQPGALLVSSLMRRHLRCQTLWCDPKMTASTACFSEQLMRFGGTWRA